MCGYYLQVPESALASVLVDDQERQHSGSVPFGKVHPEVRAALEARLAGLLPSPLFELVQQRGNSSIQVIPDAEGIERSYVFGMPDLTAMPATAASDWMSAAFPGLAVTLPGV
jgi:hypothetical protein